jgi:hypothetical protein
VRTHGKLDAAGGTALVTVIMLALAAVVMALCRVLH